MSGKSRACEWAVETEYLSATTEILRASEVFNITTVGNVGIKEHY